MWPVAYECPATLRVGVAHLDPLDQDPVPFLALVDGQDVVGPGAPWLLHPSPHRWSLLPRLVHEALFEHHRVAEGCERRLDLVGVRAAYNRAAAGGDQPVSADRVFDLAHGITGY